MNPNRYPAAAHIGDVQPYPAGGYTWTCRCGATAGPGSHWQTYDQAASALGRHIHKAEQKGQS